MTEPFCLDFPKIGDRIYGLLGHTPEVDDD